VANGQDGLDNPDRPPEPVAQVRVLPGALNFADGRTFSVAGQPALQGRVARCGGVTRRGRRKTGDRIPPMNVERPSTFEPPVHSCEIRPATAPS
jgi:hypothetical protein